MFKTKYIALYITSCIAHYIYHHSVHHSAEHNTQCISHYTSCEHLMQSMGCPERLHRPSVGRDAKPDNATRLPTMLHVSSNNCACPKPYAANRWQHPSMTVEQREKLLQPMPVRLWRHLPPLFREVLICRSMWTFVACPLNFCCASAQVSNSSHRSALPSLPFCISPRERLVAIRTTYSLSDLISRFPSWTCIAVMTVSSSARLFVWSRPGKVKEQFLSSLIPKNTPQPALLNLAS